MSNTGRIKRYTSYDDDRVAVDRNGKFVEYDDHIAIVAGLEKRIAGQLKLIEVAGDRISILEGDVKHMTQECEKASNERYKAKHRKRGDYETLRQLDELVNYRHSVLAAEE